MVPLRRTGSSTAYGVTAPVRPTFVLISFSLFGGKLEGDGPSRELGGRSELPPKRQIVELDHDAVGFEFEHAALVAPAPAELHKGIEPLAGPPVRLHRASPSLQLA